MEKNLGIRESLNYIIAQNFDEPKQESILTTYKNDNKAFWRSLRRKHVQDGLSGSVLSRHRRPIKSCITTELGAMGIRVAKRP